MLQWSLKIMQAETSFSDKDAAYVGLIPLVVSYFKDDLSQLTQVYEASTEKTSDFLGTLLPDCPVIAALGQSIFQCIYHLFVDRELIIPSWLLSTCWLSTTLLEHQICHTCTAPHVYRTLEFLQRTRRCQGS
ncbi:uncharacterized protein LOC125946716 [Dermacentor silvarum]|uniref:uncharacterized protein LOC125946716 n=1 Tax=Dermacentor silvarum TaxID=543639 RepID=UPI00210164C4|nr:uncharacterized protein LOC125946716 [Dermacentor silvarum]